MGFSRMVGARYRGEEMRWDMRKRQVWHRWFAWYPVEVDNYIVWLQYAERRYDYWGRFSEYRLPVRGEESR